MKPSVMQQFTFMCVVRGLAVNDNHMYVLLLSAVNWTPSNNTDILEFSSIGLSTFIPAVFNKRHCAPRVIFSQEYWTDWRGHAAGQCSTGMAADNPIRESKYKTSTSKHISRLPAAEKIIRKWKNDPFMMPEFSPSSTCTEYDRDLVINNRVIHDYIAILYLKYFLKICEVPVVIFLINNT